MFSTKSRGFNLFSALVAAVLLASGVMLTSTLVTTEEKTSFELYKTLSNYQLSDAANLVRADSLQSFNYTFRKKLEDYLAKDKTQVESTGTGFPILHIGGTNGFSDLTSSSWNKKDWDMAVSNFERAVLKTDPSQPQMDFAKVIQFVSQNTITNFDIYEKTAYGKYTVSLSMPTQKEAVDATTRALNEATTAAGNDGNFFELVDCDETGCPVGTFYFNIPMDKISDAAYEALPRIIVKDITTQDEIKIALLPRTRIKIYVPVRFFKAVFYARENAKIMAEGGVRNKIETAKLGYCGGGCEPNSSPLTNLNDNWSKSCTDDQTFTDAPTPFLVTTNYKAGDPQPGFDALKGYAIDWICSASKSHPINTGDQYFVNYNFSTGEGPTSALLPEGTTKKYLSCPFAQFGIELSRLPTKIVSSTATPLFCSFFTGVQTYVIFKETDPKYIVSGSEKYFKIGIGDTYTTTVTSGTQNCTNSGSPGTIGSCSK